MTTMDSLRDEIRQFAQERDWDQFHNPKNLAIGVNVESSELLELFQWIPDSQSGNLDSSVLEKLKDEIGDVLIYLVNLADKLDLDPLACANSKLEKNRVKYPASQVHGSARKYTEYSTGPEESRTKHPAGPSDRD